jgi:hypothetical protein
MTVPLPSAFQQAIAFLDTHLIYWFMLVALIFEFRYLLHKNRREAIAMSRLGSASRNEQPAYFYFLWGLHVIAASFFTLLFIGYLAHLL